LDVRTFRGANADTDHYLIGSRIRARIANYRKERGVQMEMFNLEPLCKEEMAKRFSSKVTELLEQPIVENNNINERWSVLKESIITAATEMLGKVSRDKKENWFDEECQEATEKKNLVYRQLLQRAVTRAQEEEYKEMKREFIKGRNEFFGTKK
jgi:hypothetical protein